ncbi:amidase [bacterium]|nr:amidase [bacterium]
MTTHGQDPITERWIAHASSALHDIESRTAPDRLASELARLNSAVRNVADGKLGHDDQPGDYLALLAESGAQSRSIAGTASTEVSQTRPASAIAAETEGASLSMMAAPSLSGTAAALARGETSATALTEAALAAAHASQPRHCAFIETYEESARAKARSLDDAAAQGLHRGPLHGIPLAHKDCFEQAGRAMTVGAAVRRDAAPAERDATVIARYDTAGAVNIGSLNMNEMVCGPTGQNPHFGDCCNAWDPSRISGGSSSGSAVAVATGAIFGALGSDTGGSTRLPSSMNGVFGLKPTYGLVSRAGSFPRAFSLDSIGPIARSAEDCALLLRSVAGHDPRDPTSLDVPVPDYLSLFDAPWVMQSRVAALSLGVPCDPGIQEVFDRFTARCTDMFEAAPARDFPEMEACYALGDIISKVEAATLHSEAMRQSPERFSQAVFSRTEPGLHVPAVRYLEALSLRATVLRSFLDGPLGETDVLICPTVPLPVPLRTDADMEAPDSVFGVVAAITRLTRTFSYLGVPVLSMPIGVDANGMPVGAQLIARPLDEGRLLAVAHQLSLKMGWPILPEQKA